MIDKLVLKNFRGIRHADVLVAPITLLTGPNNAGKSTLMYALLVLKNIISNPTQPLDSFFNLGFLNLGGFKQAAFVKDESLGLYLGVETSDTEKDLVGHYGVLVTKHGGTLKLGISRPFSLSLELEVTFPYALNLNASGTFEHKSRSFQVTWNGLTPTIAITNGQSDGAVKELSALLQTPLEHIRKVDMVPLRRGFSKPVYAAVPVTPQLLTDDEVATVLASDSDLLGRVDHALERILNRNLVVFTPPTTATSYLQTRDRETGATYELVNEGFGTNQLVFLLAKIYKDSTELVCIEEPEIHLHPSAISKFVERLARTVQEPLPVRKRHFIISTHSEHFLTALLGLVAKGTLQAEDIGLYYFSRKEYETTLERCEVTEKGQVKGGLRGFYEAELAGLKDLLQAPETQ